MKFLCGPCPALPMSAWAFGVTSQLGGTSDEHVSLLLQGCSQNHKGWKKPLISSKSNYHVLRGTGECPVGIALLPIPSPPAVSCHSSELFPHTQRWDWLWVHWKPVSRRHSPVILCSQLEEQCSLKQTGLDKPSPLLELAAGDPCPQPAHISCITSACQSRRKVQCAVIFWSNGSRIAAVWDRREEVGPV